MGARVPRVWWSLVERKFACTRTKVRNHDSTERDGTIDCRRKRERERERGWKRTTTGPFFRIDVSFLCSLGDTGNPAPPISPRAFKSWKPERKSNFARGRRARTLRVDRRRDDEGERVSPFREIQIRGTIQFELDWGLSDFNSAAVYA